MSLSYSFAGRKVLITGGGQGVGRQLVQRFHDGGATVFTLDRNPQAVQQLKVDLPSVTAEVVDLSDWDETKRIILGFGEIDHLVNNAGVLIQQDFMDITKDTVKSQFETNVWAAINVTQTVAKGMIAKKGGSVVNILSVACKRSVPGGLAVYGASNAALESMTKSMARELGEHNIRVNAICSGMANTPMLAELTGGNSAAVEARKQRLIIKRMIETNEIADLVLFLLSPLAAMITGESVAMDGGYLVC